MNVLIDNNKKKILLKNLILYTLFVFLAFLYTYLAWKSNWIYVGHDRPFHLERLEEAYQNVKHGHFFVSLINSYSFGKIGQAIDAYYPWGNLLPYVIIRSLFSNPIISYYAYLTLNQFLGLLIAFYCSEKIYNSFNKGLLFTLILRFSTIVMFNDYTRVDIGESWAFVFVPMSFYGLYSLLQRKEYKKGCLLLSLGLSLELYCHVMISFLTVVVMFLLLIVWMFDNYASSFNKQLVFKTFKSLLISIFLFILNTLAITLPIIIFSRGIALKLPDKAFFATRQLSFSDFVTASFNNDILSVINFGTIGIVILIYCIANYYRFTKLSKSLFVVGFSLMLFSTKLFPWYLLKNTIISSIQFGWRFMPFAFLLIVFIFVFEIDVSSFKAIVFSVAIIILMIGSITNFISEQSNYADDALKSADAYSYNLNSKSYNNSLSYNHIVKNSYYLDYLPVTSLKKSGLTYNHIANINGKRVQLYEKNISPIYQGEHYIFTNTDKVYRAEIPFVVYNLKDYVLKINGKQQKVRISKNRLLYVESKKPIKNIDIKYITPKKFIYARYISLVSLLVTSLALIRVSLIGIKRD